MNGVGIIHTADLHLDAPFSAFSPEKAERRREQLRQCFLSLVKVARERGTRLFLISGDLFDSEYATKDTAELLRSGFESLPECRFFVSPGNHDPYTGASVYASAEFPENVHVFRGRECVPVPELGVNVYGYGFVAPNCTESPVDGYGVLDSNKINILVCHGDMSSVLSTNGPVSLREIGDSGFDYVALGHIHRASGVRCESGVHYAYPGCLCGRSFDETGRKTALVGTVGKGEVSLEEVCVSTVRFETADCDLTGCATRREATERLCRAAEGFGADTVLRLTAFGDTESELILPPDLLKGLSEAEVQIVDLTRPVMSFTRVESESTLKGIFYKAMCERIDKAQPGSEEHRILVKALKYGLGALGEKPLTDFGEDAE